MAIPQVEMNMQDLLNFTFLENKTARIVFSSSMFKSTSDLFYFCVDFVCKGLVLLFSADKTKLYLTNISLESLVVVRDKMSKLGIVMNVKIEDIPEHGLEPKVIVSGNGEHLTDYVLYLKINNIKYLLSFELERI